jgi:predicted Zn-dependent protease
MRTRDDIHALLQSVLDAVTADEAQVSYDYEQRTATRFGENAITQNLGGTSEQIKIDVAFGAREGSATTNRLDRDALIAAARRAEEIGRAAPENPEHVPVPGPQIYPEVPEAFFAASDALTPDDIAADVAHAIGRARAGAFTAAGLFESVTTAAAIANSRGLFGHDRRTLVSYSATFHGPAGSGKVAVNENDRGRIDVAHLAETAARNASAAQDPVEIAPGDYTVILEPLAVNELLMFLLFTMSARDAAEGSSVFAGTIGTQLVSDKVTLALRLDEPRMPAPPFGRAGLATRPTTWIEAGRLQRLHHDRFWAAQQGTAADATLFPLFMAGEDRSIDDLVRSCRRGLLVKSFWYIRFVDRKALMLTGMTRDGLFLVEDGRIVRPVKNLRWNESPIACLQNVVGLSRPERVGDWPFGLMPAIMSDGFTFTSTTDSV